MGNGSNGHHNHLDQGLSTEKRQGSKGLLRFAGCHLVFFFAIQDTSSIVFSSFLKSIQEKERWIREILTPEVGEKQAPDVKRLQNLQDYCNQKNLE